MGEELQLKLAFQTLILSKPLFEEAVKLQVFD